MPAKKDLVGRRYGKLIVLSEHKEPGQIGVLWDVKCECGNTKVYDSSRLKHINSCGCGGRVRDLTGETFGYLTVLSEAKRGPTGAGRLNVKCVCGKEIVVESINLRTGHTKSCGCLGKPPILTGDVFGRLTVIEEVTERTRKGHKQYLCSCECGNTKITTASSLRNKTVRSCGCWQRESRHTHTLKHGHTVGYQRSTEFNTWVSMLERCNNPNNHAYSDYGGRGIKVCDRWMGDDGFANFFADMGEKPKGTSLERVDNSKGYNKENCVYATRKVQARNRRSSLIVEHNGESKSLAEWCEQLEIPYEPTRRRLHRGQSMTQILNAYQSKIK